jgi:signal transduction histidine kinase
MEGRESSGEQPLKSLHGELVQLVAEQARRIPLQRYLTSVLMALLLMAYVPPLWAALWMALVLTVVAFRTRIVMALPGDARRSDEEKLKLIARLFWASGLVQALVVAFFPFVPVTIDAIITIYLIGICSATLHATAGFQRVCRPYVMIMMLPVLLVWTLAPDATWYERGFSVVLTLVFITTLLNHAKGTFHVFEESWSIRHQRDDLNRRLRAALDSAEAANRAKTRFLASASHDLRQPIHALSLFSGSLLLRPMDTRTAAIADQIDKAVQSLASQLDALLDISRLDAGVIERSVSTVDLKEMLLQLEQEFRPLADRKGLRLCLRCPSWAVVRTDPLLFQRILRNLLSNAVKYTEKGEVSITVEGVYDSFRVTVGDTGPGIPESEQGRVFEEFYQLNNPERDRAKGLGLGLAIVRRLTELLDVKLQLESQPGSGSRFSIDVPAAKRNDPPVLEAPAIPVGTWQHIQVLVIDDEEAVRLGMKTLLEEMGFRVQVAASTEAAIDAARQVPPSIVLADWRLRGQDNGMRTIHALRVVWPQLPALLISGDTAPDRLREAHLAGISLLHKPVSSALLRDTIVKAVNA